MVKSQKTYKQLRHDLDEILAWFQQEDLDVDQAIDKYEQALAAVKQIKDHLEQVENKITTLG